VKTWIWTGVAKDDWSLPAIALPEWVANVLQKVSDWWDKVKTWFWGNGDKATWSLPEIALPAWVTGTLQTVSDWWDKARGWFKGLNWKLPSIGNPDGNSAVIETVKGWSENAAKFFDFKWTLPEIKIPDSVRGAVSWVEKNVVNPLKKILTFHSTITVNYSSNGGGGNSARANGQRRYFYAGDVFPRIQQHCRRGWAGGGAAAAPALVGNVRENPGRDGELRRGAGD
jgi:hypothetical protein